MAAHNLAIAKASLAAGLMRPDPLPVSKEELKRFHEFLDAVLEKCSTNNIQRCKEWLLTNQISSSSSRAGVFGKYLAALSSNLKAQDKKRASSTRRQHLSILYLLNDLLHHLKYHEADQSVYRGFVEGVYRSLSDCLGHAATYEEKSFPRHKGRINRLLKEWSRHQYFESNLQKELEQIANKAALTGTAGAGESTGSIKREEPYIMPAMHGDPSAPYHELPAGNLMPHIVTNTSIPINPYHVRALQFTPGPAEPALVEVVKSFLKDIDLLYGNMIPEDEGISMELDDLGQKVVRDKQSGLVLSTESYYGWSKEFCENMRRKQNSHRRSRSRDSNDSRGRSSRSPRKRMRYASRDRGGDRQRNQSESYSRSRSTSRSRSRSLPRQGMGLGRSRSRSRSLSQSPSRPGLNSKPHSRTFQNSSQALSSSTSTIRSSNQQDAKSSNVPPAPTQVPRSNQQVYLPMQQPIQNVPFPPNNNYHMNAPIPPPRPMNWQGPWPPPPPPPSASMPGGQSYGMYQPLHHQIQQYQYTNSWPGMHPAPTLQTPLPPPPPQGENHSNYGHNQSYIGNANQNGRGRNGNQW